MKKLALFVLSLSLFLAGCAVVDTIPFISPEEEPESNGALLDPSPEAANTEPPAPAVEETLPQQAEPPAATAEQAPASLPTESPVPQEAPIIPEPTQPQTPTLVYRVQPGSPAASPNLFHPELECHWMGIAGQVLNEDGSPADNLIVEVGGTLGGNPVKALALTGSAPAYGPGGYEIMLAESPSASQGALWLQVFDLQDQPVSEKIPFDTYAACDQSLIILNFQRDPQYWNFLPGIDG